MAQTQGIRMKNPAHPGAFVKTEIIEPLGAVSDERRSGTRHHARGSFCLPE